LSPSAGLLENINTFGRAIVSSHLNLTLIHSNNYTTQGFPAAGRTVFHHVVTIDENQFRLENVQWFVSGRSLVADKMAFYS
jgi:hypothetical protein